MSRLAAALLAAVILSSLAAVATPAQAVSSCATPNVCASVVVDEPVHTASLYGASGPVAVTISGHIQVSAQVGHFVELDLAVVANGWAASISPSHVRLQNDAQVPFSATVQVPAD